MYFYWYMQSHKATEPRYKEEPHYMVRFVYGSYFLPDPSHIWDLVMDIIYALISAGSVSQKDNFMLR